MLAPGRSPILRTGTRKMNKTQPHENFCLTASPSQLEYEALSILREVYAIVSCLSHCYYGGLAGWIVRATMTIVALQKIMSDLASETLSTVHPELDLPLILQRLTSLVVSYIYQLYDHCLHAGTLSSVCYCIESATTSTKPPPRPLLSRDRPPFCQRCILSVRHL